MATANSIPPFPGDIHQEYFGAWLSGFVDGEGCFILRRGSYPRRGPMTAFVILLRADDTPVLQLIQCYWQIGNLRARKPYDYLGINRKPQSVYECSRIGEQMNVIIPHFLKFPLLAKKRRDFTIWSQAVQLAYAVSLRHKVGRPDRRQAHKWSTSEVAEFDKLAEQLRAVREFELSSDPIKPKLLGRPAERTLFDGMD